MKKKSTIRKILNYIKKYRWLMLLSILLAALTVVLTLYVPILVGKAIDCIVAPGKVNFSILGYLLIQIAIVAALTALFQWIMNMINNRVTYHVVRDIRADAFRKIQILPLKFLDAHQSGEIISRVIADVDQFADGLLMGFTQLFSGIVTILVTLVFILFINVKIIIGSGFAYARIVICGKLCGKTYLSNVSQPV